jgi:hypothetical protein
MSQAAAHSRWRATVTQAARQVLLARWRSTPEALEAPVPSTRACTLPRLSTCARCAKAAQRVHELEQLRTILAYELHGAR